MNTSQPLPEIALTGPQGHAYTIRYEVTASTRLEAITRATTGLRSDLTVRGVHRDEQLPGGQWRVVLSVWEDAG